jgi:preprotein translocase subunit YajC
MIIVIYLLVLVAAFFFLIVLPQRRRMAGHRALMSALQVGDEVVNTGGLHGRIRALDDEIVEMEIAPNVVVKVARGAISARVAPPATDDSEAA